jgi:hypothetical protein
MRKRAVVLATLIFCYGPAAQAAVMYSLDLHASSLPASPSPFISTVVGPQDTNFDGWFESVLRVNVGDPGLGNPADVLELLLSYDATPRGVSINVGDSATNNGFDGDSATQSNDAEVQIGSAVPPQGLPESRDLAVFGNDLAPSGLTFGVPDLASSGSKILLTVSDQTIGWSNFGLLQGEFVSPYLFALAGQNDSEGPVNYDIFVGLNRSIASFDRIGSGLATIDLCLRTQSEESCFAPPTPIPLPPGLPLIVTALVSLGLAKVTVRGPGIGRWGNERRWCHPRLLTDG